MEINTELLNNNLKALRKNQYEIAQWIADAEVDSKIKLIRTNSEYPNLVMYSPGGKEVVFYDMENPVQKLMEEETNHRSYETYTTFLLGFGLGYRALVIKESAEKHHVLVVIEKNPYLLKLGLSLNDFSTFFTSETLYILGPDKNQVRSFINKKRHPLSQGLMTIITDQTTSRVEPDNWFAEFLRETLSEFAVGVGTTRHISKVSVINQFKETPLLLETPGVKNLFAKFKGVPAIVVSAGPSLIYNVHLLREFRDKALIISTDTAFRVLLAYDIRPDLVAALCYSKLNYQNFSDICHHEDIPLVYLHHVYPELVRKYQGDLFIVCGSSAVTAWLRDCWEFKGGLNTGTGIAIMCFSLAVGMKADPIILVGQDLAETNETHVEGSISSHIFAKSADVRTDPSRFIWVEGLHGRKVACPKGLYSQLVVFKRMIESTGVKVINASTFGARIEGTEEMPLAEVLKRYCKKGYQLKDIMNGCHQMEKVYKDKLMTKMETKLKELNLNIKVCQKALKTNRKIFKQIKEKDGAMKGRVYELLKSNFDLSTQVQRFAKGFPPLSFYLQDEMYHIHHPSYHTSGKDEYKYQEIELGARKNRMILHGALEGMREVKTEVRQMISVIREYFKAQETIEKAPSNPEGYYRFANWLKGVGRLKKATEYYLKAVRLTEKDVNILYGLADTLWMRERYDEARRYFQEVLKLERDHSGVLDRFSEERKIKKRYREKSSQLLDQGDWVNAIICARKVLNISPTDTFAQEVLEKAYDIRSQRIEKGNRVMALFSKSSSLQREYKGLMQQAQEKMVREEFADAVQDLQKAAAISGYTEPSYHLGHCYFELGQFYKAEMVFRDLTTEFPNNPLFHDKLGRVYLAGGKIDLAIDEMYKAAELDGNTFSYLYFEAGKIRMQSGNFAEAEKTFQKYLQSNPSSYEAITKIGTCQLAQGDLRNAKDNFRKSLQIKPDHSAAIEALKMLGQTGT